MIDAIDKSGWQRTKFYEVCRSLNVAVRDAKTSGFERYVGLEHIEPENLHIRSWGNVADGTTFTKSFKPGHVLFGKRRAYQKKAAVADFAGLCSGDILVFEAIKDVIDPKLLPFLVQSDGFFDFAVKTSAGSLSPRTKFQDLAQYEFLLPPLDQQAKLAELLWAADKVVERYGETKEALQNYLNLYLERAFTYPDKAFKKWEIMPLNECCSLQTGIAKGKQYDDKEQVEELPYLRVANVQDGNIDLTEIKKIVLAKKEINRFMLKAGDVLITEGGDFDKVGRGAVWYGEIDPCLHQNHVFSIRPRQDTIMPEFLSFQTGSPYGKSYFLKCAKKTSNLASINSSQVKAFPLIVPSVEEQNYVLQKLKGIRTGLDQVQKSTVNAIDIKKALINQLFSPESVVVAEGVDRILI